MADRISLVHVVRSTQGGIRTHVTGLATRLPPWRFGQVVAGPLERSFQAALSRANVSWVRLDVPPTLSLRRVLRAGRQLRRLLVDRGAQIVHAHGFVAGIVAAWAVRRLEPCPKLLLTAHVTPPNPGAKGLLGLPRTMAYRWLFRRVDRGIAVSTGVRDAILQYVPDAAGRWQVIYNGIDARRFQRRVDPGAKRKELGVDPAAAVVGVVARLSHEKGVDVFLDAAAKVMRQIPNVDFLVVGEGPAREKLQTLAHKLHLTGQVLFLGQRTDVPEVMNALDILVLPSREESFGLAALEGVAAGVPVIASELPGLQEVFDGVGLAEFVPTDDPDALAEAIQQELTKVSYDEAEAAELAFPGGGITSLADMLVSETEFDLDVVGLERKRQAQGAEAQSERQRLLERFDIRHMVAATIEVYEDLVRGSS
jgi:glycosyltransferase involved in cell wall biosynthesis